MTPEQQKALEIILKDIVAAMYQQMGQSWCSYQLDKINSLFAPPTTPTT
jgi:hypothetical protein